MQKAHVRGLASLLGLFCSSLLGLSFVATAEPAPRPNILFILCDDLGYGDVGVFFQNHLREANKRSEPWHLTPQLDTMAAQGVQLRQHYCPAPVCAPSRASLLLGVTQGHANVRDNQFDKALEDNHTLASVLKAGGYATAAIGKWGLQGGGEAKGPKEATKGSPAEWPAYPTRRGFDYYFGYVRHQDGHWHYPKEDGRQVWDGEQEISAGLDGCYTTDLFTARAKKWIVDHQAAEAKQPFFLYLAYDTPHAKLQLPPAPYPAGGGKVGGLQWLGQAGHMINTAGGTVDGYMHPDYEHATWDADHNPATPEVPWPNVYQRYATDVRRIDDCVGDLLQLLRDLKIDDQTLVVFTSDNGPSQESYLKEPYEANFFHAFGPFDGIKRDCWEGGIRVGALAQWAGHIPAGRVSESPSQFHDWLPTFAQLAGLPVPARSDGVSLVPTLLGTGQQEASRVYIEYNVKGMTPKYPEFAASHRGRPRGQMQAVRLGEFIGVRYAVQSHADPFEIYRIESDPQQEHDLGSDPKFADLQREMHDTVLRVRRPNPSAPRPYDAELVPALPAKDRAPGVEWRAYALNAPWVAKTDSFTPTASGTQPAIDLSHAPKVGEFAMEFTCILEVPEDGEYTLSVTAKSGGALLRVHEATVIDADRGGDGKQEVTGSIRLQKGAHPFWLYYQRKLEAKLGEPELKLKWAHAGAELIEVPADALRH